MISLLRVKYESLPDYLSSKDLEAYFNELLDSSEYSANSNEEVSECLVELAIRQWHTYELIDKQLKKKIESWIDKVWDVNSTSLIDNITSIIVNLGLENSFNKAKESLDENISEEVREILQQTIEEVKNSITDPYFGMRNL